MMQVRILQYEEVDRYDSFYMALKDITDWWEVTSEEYNLLIDWVNHRRDYHLVVKPDLQLPKTLEEARVIAAKEQDKRKKEEQKRKENQLKKKVSKEQLFEKLKKELGK